MTIINSIKHSSDDYTVFIELSRDEQGVINDVLWRNNCYHTSTINGGFRPCDYYYSTFELKHVNNATMKELERMSD